MTPATTLPSTATVSSPTPNFWGILSGEIFKMIRQPFIWMAAVVGAGSAALPWMIVFLRTDYGSYLRAYPYYNLYINTDRSLSILRVFAGFFVIIVVARVIGLDYQQGTLRIILARGVDRMQLLGAKILTAALAGLVVLVAGVAWAWLSGIIALRLAIGNLDSLKVLDATFWADARIYVLTIAISMAATLLMATFVTVYGKSLAFGMAAGLLFFPADNILTQVMAGLLYPLTHSDLWLNLTAYLLGPALNALPTRMITPVAITVLGEKGSVTANVAAYSLGTGPAVVYDTTHFLLVVLIWSLLFAVGAFVLARQRDVTE